MKKIIFFLFALAFTIMSCNKVLDVKPTDSVAAEDAIKNKAGVDNSKPDLLFSYSAFLVPCFILGPGYHQIPTSPPTPSPKERGKDFVYQGIYI